MGFWDKFKRKKATLAPEESQVIRSVQEQIVSTQEPSSNFSVSALRQNKVPGTIKRKKRASKRKVMKKRAKPRRRKAAKKIAESGSLKMEDGTNTKKWLHKDRELLGGALRDLDRELQSLRNNRKRLELKMANFSSQLGNTQDKEISLRNQISELMKKEATITKKKATAKDKLALIDQKVEKVRAIQAELKNV